MTPPLYVTRSKDWVDGPLNPIDEAEWWAFAQAHPTLVCEARRETRADQANVVFDVEVRMPVYIRDTDGSLPENCIYWEHGNLTTSLHPSDAVIRTMLCIAPLLRASVQDALFREIGRATGGALGLEAQGLCDYGIDGRNPRRA
jgi:hypothetical protein